MIQNICLSKRLLCDLNLLLNGGFNPLKGFLNKKDYDCVLKNMTLESGELWTIPIVLPITPSQKNKLEIHTVVNLTNTENLIVAKMDIESIYKPDIKKEAEAIFGIYDDNHPYIKIMNEIENVWYVGGTVHPANPIPAYDFKQYRKTPEQVKQLMKDNKWKTMVGFQTRNPMHKSHYELTKYALEQTNDSNAKLLLHPVVGVTQSCDVNYYTRCRCYIELLKYYPENTVELCLLPLSMRMAGPREAVWHALIRKNYGCTHFVVGRDHAGPSFKRKDGNSFFGPYDAHNLLDKFKENKQLPQIIKSQFIVYVKDIQKYMRIDQVPKEYEILNISGTEQRRMLRDGEDIPEWFSFPSVVNILKNDNQFLQKNKQGFCLYFVGLSGCGKSTLANAVKAKLKEITSRPISILDGDIIRRNLSKGLTFSKKDRSINVQRIGYVASEITNHNGIVFCANIAPYQIDREINREKIKNYIEIFVDTDLEDCEKRDCKELYKLARKGVIKEFTGISDPFEKPVNPEIVVNNNNNNNIENNVDIIVNFLKNNQFI